MNHGNKHFFSASFLSDDVTLSDEHSEYNFFDFEEAKELDEIAEEFKEAILICMGERPENPYEKKDKIIVTLRA